MEEEQCNGTSKIMQVLFGERFNEKGDHQNNNSAPCCWKNVNLFDGGMSLEESIGIDLEQSIVKIKSKMRNSQTELYCIKCFMRKLSPFLNELKSYLETQQEFKRKISQKLKKKEDIILSIIKNKAYLKILALSTKQQKKKVKRGESEEVISKNMSLLSAKKEDLKRKLALLQENTQIQESNLTYKKQLLKNLQNKRALQIYQLYSSCQCYPKYSISSEMKRKVYEVMDGEGDTHRDTRVLFKMHFFESLTVEHKLICNYSILNLLKLIHYLIEIFNITPPFQTLLDEHGYPNVLDSSNNIKKIFVNSPNCPSLLDDQELIYFWINYRSIYTKLSLDFDSLILSRNLVFEVDHFYNFFKEQLSLNNKDHIEPPSQISTSLNNQTSQQLSQITSSEIIPIETELLNIKYPELLGEEESSFFNKEGNFMRIIILDDQNEDLSDNSIPVDLIDMGIKCNSQEGKITALGETEVEPEEEEDEDFYILQKGSSEIKENRKVENTLII